MISITVCYEENGLTHTLWRHLYITTLLKTGGQDIWALGKNSFKIFSYIIPIFCESCWKIHTHTVLPSLVLPDRSGSISSHLIFHVFTSSWFSNCCFLNANSDISRWGKFGAKSTSSECKIGGNYFQFRHKMLVEKRFEFCICLLGSIFKR